MTSRFSLKSFLFRNKIEFPTLLYITYVNREVFSSKALSFRKLNSCKAHPSFAHSKLDQENSFSEIVVKKFYCQNSSQQGQKQRFFTASNTDRHLSCKKVCQRVSVMKTNTLWNWHFDLLFVLRTTKTPVFVFITEIL